MPELILAIDPGKTLGFILASVDNDEVEVLRVGTISGYEEGLRFIRALPSIDTIVVEDYLIRPTRMRGPTHDWSREETLKQLARIEEIAASKNVKIFHQQPSIKPAGYGWAGLKYTPGKKGLHWQDAYAHLAYFVVRQRGCRPGHIRLSEEAMSEELQ